MKLGNAQRPARGETVCGDSFIVLKSERRTIIAVADGLGHGPQAALASQAFCEFVRDHQEESIEDIIWGAHRSLGRTRGAAAALLRIDEEHHSLEFVGVGNIELRALSEDKIKPVCQPGILGQRMKKVMVFNYRLNAGDLLAVHSDGISHRMELKRFRNMEPQEMAAAILREYGKYHDDVICVVVRY